MNRSPIREALNRVESLATEIDGNVPADKPSLSDFRSDLAGLLNVTVCATYENCVKLVIHEYSGRQSPKFLTYTQNQYDRINSRIDINDLHKYAKTFSPEIGHRFKSRLNSLKEYYLDRVNSNILDSYVQLLKWRHDFAHTGQRVTTVEEVIKHHKLGKRVILIFSDAFASEG